MKKNLAVLFFVILALMLSACGKLPGIIGKETTAAGSAAAEKTTEAGKATTAETTTEAEKTTVAETTTTAEITTEIEATTEPPTEAGTEEGASSAESDLIRPEVKEMIDSYEEFIDQYCEFMQTYDSSSTVMLMEYMQMNQKIAEWAVKWEALAETDLNTAEELYLSEVELRCSQKMLAIAGNP